MRNICNKNYLLLLQGQLVSTFGDALYAIALSFFVLKLTGSSTLVGTIMGVVTIPRIILGPFAGVIVDRYSKKMIIILCDIIRGISILLISFLMYLGIIKVWMLIMVAIVDGICAAFFNPSMETVMPNLVEDEKLVQANSIFDMFTTGIDILGQTLGGILYNFLGANLLFLFNGLSYIFSAGTESFISIPQRKHCADNIDNSFVRDMRDGIKYFKKTDGLMVLLIMSFFLNFLFGMIRVLIIPWFSNTEGFGEIRYGIFNAACSIGMIGGMLLLSFIELKNKTKFILYRVSVFLFIILIGVSALINLFYGVIICFVFAFAFQIIFNTIMCTTIILNTEESMRGKVSSTRITICMAASPIGNFIGGVLGDLVSPRSGIIGCAVVAFIIASLFLSKKSIKNYFLTT